MVDMQVLTRPTFIIKVVELVFGTLCMGLIAGEPLVAMPLIGKFQVVHATYFGFFIVSCIVVISYILDTPIHGKLMMIIAAVATIFYITSGALNLELYDKISIGTEKILAAGIFGLLNGCAHAVDVYLSWKNL